MAAAAGLAAVAAHQRRVGARRVDRHYPFDVSFLSLGASPRKRVCVPGYGYILCLQRVVCQLCALVGCQALYRIDGRSPADCYGGLATRSQY